MRVEEIRQIARAKGVLPSHLKKSDLIRCIQRQEGNFECFGTAVDGVCSQWDCLWRADCLSSGVKGLRG
ncbi:MAG: hypothetical protein ACYC9S_10870 [Leptospirales bacterium]